MKRAYIAGPMRHYAEFNFPAFHAAEYHLQHEGWEVFSPARHDLERGFDPAGMTGEEEPEGFGIRDCMHDDLAWITKNADAVFALDGWEKSRGAVAEVAAAFSIGIPAYVFSSRDRINSLPPIGSVPENLRPINPNPKDVIGSGKIPLELVSEFANAEEALAMCEGALKYGAFNYRAIPVKSSVYIAAARRHIADWFNGVDRDGVTDVHHLGSARACLGIILDAENMGTLIDNRPPANTKIQEFLDSFQVRVKKLRELFKSSNPKHYTIADLTENDSLV